MWKTAVHVETVLGAAIAVDAEGHTDMLTWDYPPHPLSPTAERLARSVGVDV